MDFNPRGKAKIPTNAYRTRVSALEVHETNVKHRTHSDEWNVRFTYASSTIIVTLEPEYLVPATGNLIGPTGSRIGEGF